MTAPNLFVVGAAKSGSTSLYTYLGRHPEVYMSPVKEPGYFAPDLGIRANPFLSRHPELFLPGPDFWSAAMPAVRDGFDRDWDAYCSLFAAAGDERWRGEASPGYLLSQEAAGRIAAACPDGRILIVLRHPVDLVHSLYDMLALGEHAPTGDLVGAVEATRDRPPDAAAHPWTDYWRVGNLAVQVERYLTTFGREAVHVSLLDDIVDDAAAWFAGVEDFLGISHRSIPLEPVNEYRVPRLRRLHDVLLHPSGRPGWVVRHRRAEALRARLLGANLRTARRTRLPAAERATLTGYFAPDIERLAGLIDRDLSSWLAATPTR